MANKLFCSAFGRILLVGLVMVSLAACNTSETRDVIERGTERTTEGVQRARTPAPPVVYNPLVVTDEAWAGGKSLRLRNGVPLPARFENNRAVTLVSADPMTLTDINNTIASQTSIPQRLGAGVDNAIASKKMQVNYVGSLAGLLNQVANFYELNWQYDGAAISFSRFETRVFTVEALPGKNKYSDKVGGDDNNSSSSSSSSSSNNSLEQENNIETDLDYWKELTDGVNAILGGVGRAMVGQSTGTITVTTTTEVMKNVAKYIQQQNDLISKQVAINVQVYTVDLDSKEDFKMTFNTVLRHLGPVQTDIGGAAGALGSVTGAGNFAVSILDEGFGQIDSVLNSLSSVGNASRVAEFPMTTINNRPVSRRVGRDVAYLQSVTSTSTTNAGTTTSLTPGTVREGFSLQLTPRMMMDGRMLLQYSLSLQEIVGTIKSFSSGGNSIQLPETSSRVFVQQSMLRSGQTLILAGFSDDKTSQSSEGVLSPFNYVLGGGANNRATRQMLFIAITPQEIEIPRTE